MFAIKNLFSKGKSDYTFTPHPRGGRGGNFEIPNKNLYFYCRFGFSIRNNVSFCQNLVLIEQKFPPLKIKSFYGGYFSVR